MANDSAKAGSTGSSWRKRVLAWGLALAALTFVATVVPIRDRCDDPGGPPHAQVAATRDAAGCLLHRVGGDFRVPPEDCDKLHCEPGLVSSFAHARLPVVFGLLALYFAGIFAWASRWHALLSFTGVKVTRLELWRITLESQAGGILLPGGIAGDALRVGFVVSRGADLSIVIASVLLDRFVGLATLTGGAAALGAIYGAGDLGPMVAILGAMPVAFVVGLVLLRWPAFSRLPVFMKGPLAKVARPILDYVGHPGAPRAILLGLAYSVFVSLVQFACMRGLLFALGVTPSPERWVYLGTTMAFVVSAIPALPGGWGTTDAAFVYFFAKAGIAGSVALAASLIYRLFWYCSGGSGAVLYLFRQQGTAKVPAVTAEARTERKA